MSQSTKLYTRIVFNAKTYNGKYEVENDLEFVQKQIEKTRKDILILGLMTEPAKFAPQDMNPADYITRNCDELLDYLKELYVDEYKLSKLLAEWDICHNEHGIGINPPDDQRYKIYIDGDFVLTEKYPDNKAMLESIKKDTR